MEPEWDPNKAEANLREHGVAFEDAFTVMDDEFALTRKDPDSVDEQRFVTLGMSNSGSLLVVVYTYRSEEAVRIISAWSSQQAPEEAI